MARFKPIHKGLKLLPVDFDRQVIPGTFEYTLNYIIDHELNPATFAARFNNDDTDQQHRLKALQSAWLGEGEYPMEAILYCA